MYNGSLLDGSDECMSVCMKLPLQVRVLITAYFCKSFCANWLTKPIGSNYKRNTTFGCIWMNQREEELQWENTEVVSSGDLVQSGLNELCTEDCSTDLWRPLLLCLGCSWGRQACDSLSRKLQGSMSSELLEQITIKYKICAIDTLHCPEYLPWFKTQSWCPSAPN